MQFSIIPDRERYISSKRNNTTNIFRLMVIYDKVIIVVYDAFMLYNLEIRGGNGD